jgi:NAD(P)-dependent dehydrogenase (short-subunit alcohol dehydrogenase family)
MTTRVAIVTGASSGIGEAMELAPFGIHVMVIEPGPIRTEWSAIAANSLVVTSGTGAYASQAVTVAKVMASSAGNPSLGSSPDVIARAVAKAVTSSRPRARSVVGTGARPMLFARRHLSDRAFDRLTDLAFRVVSRRSDRAAQL